MKKIMSLVLSVCMVVMMSVPAFAYSSSDAMKVQLSDQAMTAAVGGSGALDATLDSYRTNGTVSATVVNRSTVLTCSYSLTIEDCWGNVYDTIASGDMTLKPGEALHLTGTTTYLDPSAGYVARVCVWNPGLLPGFKACDVQLGAD